MSIKINYDHANSEISFSLRGVTYIPVKYSFITSIATCTLALIVNAQSVTFDFNNGTDLDNVSLANAVTSVNGLTLTTTEIIASDGTLGSSNTNVTLNITDADALGVNSPSVSEDPNASNDLRDFDPGEAWWFTFDKNVRLDEILVSSLDSPAQMTVSSTAFGDIVYADGVIFPQVIVPAGVIIKISNTSDVSTPTNSHDFRIRELSVTIPQIVDVYILAGQSNMSGRVSSDGTGGGAYTAVPGVDDDILYYYRSDGPTSSIQTSNGAFTTLSPLPTGYYGPEIAMSRLLHADSTNKIAIIKISKGDTSLFYDWNSINPPDNFMWQHWVSDTTDAINDLLAIGYTINLKGICWCQGEGDGDFRSAGYLSRFTALVDDMYAHLETLATTDGMRFVTATTNDSYDYTNNVDLNNRTVVRNAQKEVMDSNAYWSYFDTELALSDEPDSFPFAESDGTHFDGPAIAEIGRRFAEALLASPEVSNFRVSSEEGVLEFFGILYESDNLSTWIRRDPQPASPFEFTTDSDKQFYQVRDR